MAPRVLTVLGATGKIVRGFNNGAWTTSRPVWTTTSTWLGDRPLALAAADGYADLVRRWLWSYGPGTEDDLAWWLGATRADVRHALQDASAAPVQLEDSTRRGSTPTITTPSPAKQNGQRCCLPSTPPPWLATP